MLSLLADPERRDRTCVCQLAASPGTGGTVGVRHLGCRAARAAALDAPITVPARWDDLRSRDPAHGRVAGGLAGLRALPARADVGDGRMLIVHGVIQVDRGRPRTKRADASWA